MVCKNVQFKVTLINKKQLLACVQHLSFLRIINNGDNLVDSCKSKGQSLTSTASYNTIYVIYRLYWSAWLIKVTILLIANARCMSRMTTKEIVQSRDKVSVHGCVVGSMLST